MRRVVASLFLVGSMVALAGCEADQPLPAAAAKDADVAVVQGGQVHLLPKVDPGRASSAATNAASSLKLSYYGGHVISNVKVVAVFWGASVDSQIQSQIGSFYSAVTNSAHMDWLSEYDTNITAMNGQQGTGQHIGRGTFAGAYTITPSHTGSTVYDSDIQAEINSQISAGHLPAPDANTIYMTYFPKGISIDDGSGSKSCVQFCAYHGTFSRNGASTYYGVMPSLAAGTGCDSGCGTGNMFNDTTSVSSHELIEAVTDGEVGLATGSTLGPPLAWYNSSQGEIGDICNGQQGTIAGYTVQKEWDNATGTCIVSKGTTTNDFSVSLTPATASVAAGSSVTYTVKTAITSGAAQNVTLSVSGLPSGVTASFSPATVSAGANSTLTLSAAASAGAGATTFTVTGAGASASHSANASITVTTSGGGGSCINGTFTATGLPMSIPDNNTTGITSSLAVSGDGTVGSLALSLKITHTYRGDLVVTLTSPDGTAYSVSNRAGGSADDIVLSSSAISAFNGKTAAGTWKLKVQDLAAADVGTLDSWSLAIVGNCSGGGGTGGGSWSASGSPNLATVDNGSACTTLSVSGTGNAADAKVDLSGRHDYRSILKGTLSHGGVTQTVFNTGTFAAGAGTFTLSGQAVAGFSGSATGDWQLCIIDTDAYGDTGTLNTWSVHN